MIFRWILETSISASIIVLIILGIRRLIKNKVSPCILYYMWFVVIIKLVVPNGPESQISLYNIFSKSEVSVEQKVDKVETRSINEEINISEEVKIESRLGETEDELYKTQINNKTSYLTLKEALGILWGLGVFILIIRSAYSYILIRKYVKGKEYHDSMIESILLENLKILSFRSKVRIILSNKFESPSLVGVIKPRIIIPENIMEKSSSEELKYILLHELTHLKRKDNIIIWFSLIIRIIYWFNPMIIFSMNLMQKDCEISCDANVLNKVDSKENIKYGMSILKVLSSINTNRRDPGVIAMIRNKKEVKERINMISKNKKYGAKSLIIGCVLIGVLCGVGLTSKTIAEIKEKGKSEITEENTNDLVDLASKSSSVIEGKDVVIDEVVDGKINSNIVVYSTHYEEGYVKGDDENLTVVDAGRMLSSKLKENGIDSGFLEITKERPYDRAWETSRELVIEKVEKYEEKMLIDIHRSGTAGKDEENKRVIKIAISTDSSRYEENKEFVNKLLNELKSQGVTVKTNIYEDDNSIKYPTLDSSGQSIYLEIGSPDSNKSDIEFCTEKITEAIKKIN